MESPGPKETERSSATTEPVVSVAELARRLKRSVEAVTGREWIEGELASLKVAASGHFYFKLKDEREDALLDCVMFRSQAFPHRRILVEGARLQVMGKTSVFVPRGALSFNVERVRERGRGALLEALEQTRLRLAAEGLFAPERKRPLPAEPRLIGLVTSATGAAWRDVVAVAHRRGGARILLSPAQVQGDAAVPSLLLALSRLLRVPEVDVVIIGRGGGAGEDLMAFNDERLVRALAECRVPVVSAVGHDIDITLADLVADVRAATPSQAAELVVADRARDEARLAKLRVALVRSVERRLAEDQVTCSRLVARLGEPRFVIATHQQGLDELRQRLTEGVRVMSAARHRQLEQTRRRLLRVHPQVVLVRARGRLEAARGRLLVLGRQALSEAGRSLGETAARLSALSPLAVLARGYAITTRLDGRAIQGPDALAVGDRFLVRWAEGGLQAEVRQKLEADELPVDAEPTRCRPSG